jgi:hypothetical protein
MARLHQSVLVVAHPVIQDKTRVGTEEVALVRRLSIPVPHTPAALGLPVLLSSRSTSPK